MLAVTVNSDLSLDRIAGFLPSFIGFQNDGAPRPIGALTAESHRGYARLGFRGSVEAYARNCEAISALTIVSLTGR